MVCFEAQVGALCWVHAINMSLGCQILQIALSREVAGAYYNEHTRTPHSTETDSTSTA